MSDALPYAATEPAPANLVVLHPNGVRPFTDDEGRTWLQSWRDGAVRAQFVVTEEDLTSLRAWLVGR